MDTPGFDDDRFDDDVVVTRILTWLKNSFDDGIRLNGLIYMHRITDPRMRGTAVSNMRMFRKLCGPDCFQNVILATTFWGQIDPDEGQRREQELCQDERFWGRLVKRKSRVIRIESDVESDRSLLLNIASNNKCTLAAQQEMQEGASMLATGAAQETSKNLALLQQQYDEQLRHEKDKFDERLARRKRLAKAELDAQKLASEKEREDLSRLARREMKARKIAWEHNRQMEQQKHARDKAPRVARLQRLQAQRDREKERQNLDRQKRSEENARYYKNYKCVRRTLIRRFRCNRCLNLFDARVVKYYRKLCSISKFRFGLRTRRRSVADRTL